MKMKDIGLEEIKWGFRPSKYLKTKARIVKDKYRWIFPLNKDSRCGNKCDINKEDKMRKDRKSG